MAANVEKSSFIRFVDELDFQQIPVSVKRKKKEECPTGLILVDSNCEFKRAESSSESFSGVEDEVEDENNSDQDQTSSSCSESGEISKKGEVREKGKPRATTSVKKSSKKRKVSKNILSEEEVEELCERLESKRHDLYSEIAKKLESSPNLTFYPSRSALKEAILGDKNVLNEITDEFVEEFIGVIGDVYHTKMTATDKKAALSHEWSKKLRPFLSKEMWQKFCEGLSSKCKMVISHADGIAVLSGIHEAIYDFTHALSHERVIDLPSRANTSDGLPIEDRIILHRFGGAALCRMIKLRENTIKGQKGTIKVTDRHKEELENELEVLFAMKMNDKSSLPSELKEHLDEGGLYFLKEEFISFVQFADNCTRRLTTERRFRRSPSSFLKFIFSSVNGNTDIFSVFRSALKAVGVTTESAAVRTVYEQLLTKICRTRVKVFLQAMKERDLQKQKKVADVDVSLRDKLKGFVVRSKRQ